jgi:hypothetical protein
MTNGVRILEDLDVTRSWWLSVGKLFVCSFGLRVFNHVGGAKKVSLRQNYELNFVNSLPVPYRVLLPWILRPSVVSSQCRTPIHSGTTHIKDILIKSMTFGIIRN